MASCSTELNLPELYCGHTFCQGCLTKTWVNLVDGELKHLSQASLSDVHLAAPSKSGERVLLEPTSSPEKGKCSVHKKMLEFSCIKDGALICVSGCLVGEHKGHNVEMLSEASERKKEKLRNILEKMSSKQGTVERKAKDVQTPTGEIPNKAPGVTQSQCPA
ncbi:tripartite motif-containing protein 5-like [Xenopus tropicalis]|uniref:Tripartite motif-containing protein 5-like n=1 Tax=Xenopus tropicalis TaxID=8364 RepID=A0A8J1IXD1_XENTR|nr:tripartite motif-containing protein 5-like [Xenopus tropicalis]